MKSSFVLIKYSGMANWLPKNKNILPFQTLDTGVHTAKIKCFIFDAEFDESDVKRLKRKLDYVDGGIIVFPEKKQTIFFEILKDMDFDPDDLVEISKGKEGYKYAANVFFEEFLSLFINSPEKENIKFGIYGFKQNVQGGNDMTPLSELAKTLIKLKERQTKFHRGLDRNDVSYDIVIHLINTGGTEQIDLLARKFRIAPEKLQQYIEGGLFLEEDWILSFENANKTVQLNVSVDDVCSALELVDKDKVPPRTIIVSSKEGKQERFKSSDLLKLVKIPRGKFKIAKVFKHFFESLPNDALGRPPILVEQNRTHPNWFVVRGSFWEFIVLVEVGKSAKNYFVDKDIIFEAQLQAKIQEGEDFFIEEFYPVVISAGFTDAAKHAASFNPKVLTFPLTSFIRLASYIQSGLKKNVHKQIAAWSLFKLPSINATSPEELISLFTEEVEIGISEYEST